MDFQTFCFNLGVKLGTFSDFCEKGGKITGLNKATQLNPSQAISLPSQACEPELRPSEPPSSATEQPSPVLHNLLGPRHPDTTGSASSAVA